MWESVKHIATPIALGAFFLAALVTSLRAWLRHRQKILLEAPPENLNPKHGEFGVSAEGIKHGRRELVLAAFKHRERKLTILAILFVILAIIAAGILALAIHYTKPNAEPTTIPVTGNILFDGRPLKPSDMSTVVVRSDSAKPINVAQYPDGSFSFEVYKPATSATVRAAVNGYHAESEVVLNIKHSGVLINVKSEVQTLDEQLAAVDDLRWLGPLDSVKTAEYGWLPKSFALGEKTPGGKSERTGFILSDDVALKCDLSTTLKSVILDRVMVKVISYMPPPKILDAKKILPAADAHLYRVIIDKPSNPSGEELFEGKLSEGDLSYLRIDRDLPERVFVIVGAKSAGVYKFSIGFQLKAGKASATYWSDERMVYFLEPGMRLPVPKVCSRADALSAVRTRKLPAWAFFSKEVDVAVEGVRNLGETEDAEVFNTLVSALEDRQNVLHVWLVGPVCEAIGKMRMSASYNTLRGFYEGASQNDQKIAALHGIVCIGDEVSFNMIVEELGKASSRDYVLPALPRPLPPKFGIEVVKSLRGASKKERAELMWYLRYLESPDVQAYLVELLDSCDDATKINVIGAFLGTQLPAARSKVLLACSDKDPKMREAAVQVVGSFGKDGVGTLMDSMQDKEFAVRKKAVECAAQIPGGEADAILVRALNDEVEGVRVEAFRGLALKKCYHALPVMVDSNIKHSFSDYTATDAILELAQNKDVAHLVAMLRKLREMYPDVRKSWEYHSYLSYIAKTIDKLAVLTGERFGFLDTTTGKSDSDKWNIQVMERWLRWAQNGYK